MHNRVWALWSAALLLFSLPSVQPARADTADASTWKNPFCSADVYAFPWNKAQDEPATLGSNQHYGLSLFADGKSTVTATVMLIAEDGAYTVTVDRGPLLRSVGSDRFYAPPILVDFDKPQNVLYAYVDTVGVDGAAPTPCPTVVEQVRSLIGHSPTGTQRYSLAGAPVAPATFKQALPPLTCGSAYIDPVLLDREGPDVGNFGSKQLDAFVHVYIDSEGHPMNATIERSSGVEGIDDLAVAGAEESHYRPAQFLCTPVVSEMTIDLQYGHY